MTNKTLQSEWPEIPESPFADYLAETAKQAKIDVCELGNEIADWSKELKSLFGPILLVFSMLIGTALIAIYGL